MMLLVLVMACSEKTETATRPLVSVNTPLPITTILAPVPAKADPIAWALAYCSYREERQVLLQYNYDAFGTADGMSLVEIKKRASVLHPSNKVVLSQFAERLKRLPVPDGAVALRKAELDLTESVLEATDELLRGTLQARTISDVDFAKAKYDAEVKPAYDAVISANFGISEEVASALRYLPACGHSGLKDR
jgi:hypothetical protein